MAGVFAHMVMQAGIKEGEVVCNTLPNRSVALELLVRDDLVWYSLFGNIFVTGIPMKFRLLSLGRVRPQ
jgi:hypothetical protein